VSDEGDEVGPIVPSSNGHGLHPEEARPAPKAWRRRLFVVVLVVMIGVWGFAFWYSVARVKPEPLDEASRAALVGICTDTLHRLGTIPQVPSLPSVAQRAARVRAEDAVLDRLIARAAQVHPKAAEGRRALTGWLGDWRHVVADRETYAARVLTGGRPRLVVPIDPTGKPVTIRMADYADGHRMAVCSPVTLHPEVVEGPRTYSAP
jgi:hypothetical protein